MTELAQRFKYNGNLEVLEKLVDFINSSEEKDLYHIDVYDLASKWHMSRKDMLDIFIHGLHEGIFSLEWFYHCTHCGGVPVDGISLHTASSTNLCTACNVTFTNRLDDNIEVFFTIHPEVKKLISDFKGIYKKEMIQSLQTKGNFIWQHATNIRGIELVQNSTYRRLMGNDVLPQSQSLEIKKTTIFFTDVKGSTQLYTDLGDAHAFKLVNEHFDILFDIIERHNGIAVKTIGDAVMGAFSDQAEGLRAALEAQKTLIDHYKNKSAKEKLEVKIGIHTGNSLIVTLNGKLDYFGSTINMSARIQGIAEANEVVVSDVFFNSIDTKKIMREYTNTVYKSDREFKGLQGEFTIYRIKMSA